MPLRSAQPSSARRRLPLALSLAFHGLVLAALCRFAPLHRATAIDAEPLTVRFVPHACSAQEPLECAPCLDRKTLPPESSAPALPAPAPSAEELLATLPQETCTFATEEPASARRSVLGAGLYACTHLPHGPVAATAAGPATTAAEPVASACAATPAAVNVLPEPLDCPAPEYPAGSATANECGKVRLQISLGADGRVEKVRILRSSGFARLDEAAERGVEQWRFRPALVAGTPARWTLEHTIVFRSASARG
jgi:periplasmic protein TonB